jgi:hypothetical protein
MNVYRVEVSSKGQIRGFLELYWTPADDMKKASNKVLKRAEKDYPDEHPVVSKIERMDGIFVA